ncbi:Uncharacterised protein [Streptococcus pneumoniae]|nr:Uncharacterised protein [Streptococcus pneumoniae]COF49676.1 Uncharacterised protein [Streptococcus pneumoniae]
MRRRFKNCKKQKQIRARNRRKLPSKSKLSTLLARISWSQHRLVLERPLSWQSAFWTNWRVVSKFLNSLSQPLPSRLRPNLRNVWKRKSANKSKKVMMSTSNNTWVVSWQTYPTQPSEPWTLLHKNSLVNMAICLILRLISVFYKTKASNSF